MFRLSFLWYTAVGCMLTVVIGVLVSLATCKHLLLLARFTAKMATEKTATEEMATGKLGNRKNRQRKMRG